MNLEDLDTLIVDADPALDTPIPSGSSAEARWRYVQLTGQPGVRVHRRRRILLEAGGIAVAAGAIALLLVNVIPGPSSPKAAAAAVLEQAAAAAEQQTTQLAPGQYLYTETQSSYQVTLEDANAAGTELVQIATAQFSMTEQAWTSASGTGQHLDTDSAVQFPSAADEATWKADPIGPSMLLNVAHFAESDGHGSQSLLNVSELPTDPNALTSVIANGELHTNVNLIPAGPDATFERAATLLLGPTVGMTPALASALFQVLANQPGVQLLGTVTDHEGQTGEGIRLETAGGLTVSEVIVNPTLGQLLEAQFALPAPTSPLPDGASVCVGPVNGSSARSCYQGGDSATISPVWTDVVASGVVGSGDATLPPVGNAPTTIALVPAAPAGLSATEIGPVQIKLSWSPPTNGGASPVTDYVLYEYQDGQTPTTGPSAVYDTHSTATTYTWSLIADGGPATFTVQAVNGDGYGAASNSVTVTP
jgi:hypothetical protein